jgi:hypothetical protein
LSVVEPAPGWAAIDVVEINPYAPRPFVFTEVCQCLCAQLRQAGWRSSHRSNAVSEDERTLSIVCVPTDGWQEFVARLDPRRTVLFNLEQLGSEAPFARGDYVQQLGRWAVADYNSANIAHLRGANGSAQCAFELPVVPQPMLAGTAPQPEETDTPSVDVLFYGSLNERRQQVIDALRAAGLSVETVAGAYAWELAPAVRRARLVLHVHFYETRRFPVARVLQPIAAGVPVLCEDSVFTDALDWSASGIVFAPLERLVPTALQLLRHPQHRLRSAQAAWRFAARLDFGPHLQRALEAHAGFVQACAAAPAGDPAELLGLAPESHLQPAPIVLATRHPGDGPFGKVGLVLFIVFVLFTLLRQSPLLG